jgi:hemolysin activation/secretion protein
MSFALAAAALSLVVSSWATAASATQEDGPRYQVDQMYLDFAEDLPVHPPTKLMMQMDIKLGEVDTGYVSARDGVPAVTIQLKDIPKLKKNYMHASAIKAIGDALVQHFAQWGYQGITVTPHPDDIDSAGKDVRLEGQTALRLIVRSMTGRGRPLQRGVIWETPDTRDGQTYTVSQFLIETANDVDVNIDTKGLLKTPVILGESEDGWYSPRPGSKQVQIRLVDVPKLGNHTFYNSALYDVSEALTKAVGIEGLYVWPAAGDIDATGKDVRFNNQTALRLTVKRGEMPERPVYIVQAPEQGAEPVEVAIDPELLPDAGEADGALYPLSQVIIEYRRDHPDLPSLQEIMDTELTLTEVKDGYVAPRPDAETNVTVQVDEIPTLRKGAMYGSAVRYMNTEIVQTFNDKGYIGVYVAPNPDDIASDGSDIRPETQTAMRVAVNTGIVSEIRTIAAGERVPMEERVNNPIHQKLADKSPVQPGGEGDSTDLLRRDMIDRYIYYKNRHPGRRMDVAIAPGQEPGTVALDLLVTESKPWMVYAQVSNTGTKQTEEWRERFGFIHNQLTNNDDILTVDYITAAFDSAHAVNASYEAPLFDLDRWRWGINGSWSEFTASDVGFANEEFTGNSWSAGADLIANVFQWNETFVDVVGGVKWQQVEVRNEIIRQEGSENFFLPHIGVELERVTETMTTLITTDFEQNIASVADTQDQELVKLGRLFADEDSRRMTWFAQHSMYIEPLLWRDAWEDVNTPSSSTLAHELVFITKGQYAFGTRLNPQRERTVGGLYSVRGYEESLVAADTAVMFTAEYRFHLPRVFAPQQDPEPFLWDQSFKWRPQYVYGRPDWDLILRGFFDYGLTVNSERQEFEEDETLMSTGVGVELLFKRNLSVRVDWGYVLNEVEGREADIGDSRLHVVGTLLY